MKALVVVPGISTHSVTLKERPVLRGGIEQKRALSGANVQRAVQSVQTATHWPAWFAENVVRWRASRGLVLASVLNR